MAYQKVIEKKDTHLYQKKPNAGQKNRNVTGHIPFNSSPTDKCPTNLETAQQDNLVILKFNT